LEAVRAASKQAQATNNNQQYNLPSKSTIADLFGDAEVVEKGKVKFGESVGSIKVKDMQRRTWYKFDVGEENKNPLRVASSTRYRRNVQVSMRTDDETFSEAGVIVWLDVDSKVLTVFCERRSTIFFVEQTWSFLLSKMGYIRGRPASGSTILKNPLNNKF
jgi:hypothetical protein